MEHPVYTYIKHNAKMFHVIKDVAFKFQISTPINTSIRASYKPHKVNFFAVIIGRIDLFAIHRRI